MSTLFVKFKTYFKYFLFLSKAKYNLYHKNKKNVKIYLFLKSECFLTKCKNEYLPYNYIRM